MWNTSALVIPIVVGTLGSIPVKLSDILAFLSMSFQFCRSQQTIIKTDPTHGEI